MAQMLPLFGAAALLVFGREILKDVEDEEIDGGYKWTIPLAYGNRAARMARHVVHRWRMRRRRNHFSFPPWRVLCSRVLALCWSGGTLLPPPMKWLDAGAALVIIALAAFPPG